MPINIIKGTKKMIGDRKYIVNVDVSLAFNAPSESCAVGRTLFINKTSIRIPATDNPTYAQSSFCTRSVSGSRVASEVLCSVGVLQNAAPQVEGTFGRTVTLSGARS